MKNTLLTVGVACTATILLSSFVIIGNSDNDQAPKKSRHIKMVKVVDGKKTALDTVLTTDDAFVWQGDTINPGKHKETFTVHSFNNGNGKPNVMVIKRKGGKGGEPMFLDMKTVDDMDVITDDNDTTGKKIIIRKMMKGGPGDNMIFINGNGPGHFPPVPPVPPMSPVPHIMKFKHRGQVIDLNDPNVISYKKKDLKDGLEKIEIVRKKAEPRDEEAFDFQFDGDSMMAPMAPDAPEFSDFKVESDSVKMKIIEKKKMIDGKDGKEIEVKVETPKK